MEIIYIVEGERYVGECKFNNCCVKRFSLSLVKDPNIVCWDMRNPGKVLMKMRRNVETNQRMYFDLDR